MLKQIVVAALLFWPAVGWSLDVATVVACKRDGQTWLCGAYEQDKLQVFRSERYISKVEFQGAVDKGAPLARAVDNEASAAATMASADVSGQVRGPYTLQLVACHSELCRQRMAKLEQIANSRVVSIKQQDKLWDLLLVGQYPTRKAAMQAAGDLIKAYGLKDKPWIRTLESIRSRQVGG